MGVKYEEVIERLEKIIENWFDKEELYKCLVNPQSGLCENVSYFYIEGQNNGPLFFEEHVLYDAILSWPYYSAKERYSTTFPVGGLDEYLRDFIEMYSNPKRLHLAVHMLQYLKTNGLP